MKIIIQTGPEGSLHLTAKEDEIAFARFIKMLETKRHVLLNVESFEMYECDVCKQ